MFARSNDYTVTATKGLAGLIVCCEIRDDSGSICD